MFLSKLSYTPMKMDVTEKKRNTLIRMHHRFYWKLSTEASNFSVILENKISCIFSVGCQQEIPFVKQDIEGTDREKWFFTWVASTPRCTFFSVGRVVLTRFTFLLATRKFITHVQPFETRKFVIKSFLNSIGILARFTKLFSFMFLVQETSNYKEIILCKNLFF